ncbi:hypothetical protein L2E82_18185 [Cichorium intybus]|uniref:Uncharacterized protein n=1 Tax=Cichorium intybus TaxID=13427 RepID=A0ACB9F9Q7_CICIN|nr:hypothetical protein L2E82_18185 [Cichorium intybus]
MATTTKDVCRKPCTPDCKKIIAKFHEHTDNLVREIFELENLVYNSKNKLKPLQEALEAKKSDFDKLQEEYSIKSCHLRFANENNFEGSSEVVKSMIEKQLKWDDNQGLGYKSVPPPFNNNFTPPLETEESEECYLSKFIPKDQSGTAENTKKKSTNASTLCADSEGTRNKEGNQDSKIDNLSSENCDDKPTNTFVPSKLCGNAASRKFKPQKFVKEGEVPLGPRRSPSKCGCACTCGNSFKNSEGQGPSHNLIYLKRQTCFNCGIAGHIARNCPHRLYIRFYTQYWQNVPKRRSYKRKPSRSRSRDGD